MWQTNGEKEYVLTRGGLMDMMVPYRLDIMVEIRFIMRSQPRP
jgi:hypothetical protein